MPSPAASATSNDAVPDRFWFVQALAAFIRVVRSNWRLIFELAKRQVSDRYLGQVFGILWAVGHPLVQICTYVLIFTFVFRIRVSTPDGLPLDYTLYLLAGLIPWLAFQESMSNASVIVTNNAALVKQLVFPVEILPAKVVVASVLSQLILIGLLLVYLVITQGLPSAMLLLLPVVVAAQTAAMLGVAYLLAGVGVYFRDIKDFVQVFSVIGMYLMPVFYLPQSVPEVLRPMLYANPISYMVWVYQDVLFFGRFEHWWAWPVFFAVSILSLIGGFHVFNRLRIMFGNVL